MLVTMKDILDRASAENYGVAAPNVCSEIDARAVISIAEELKAPVILDVGFRANPDIMLAGQIFRALAEKSNVPVAINLDHGFSYEHAVRAIAAGFTSVMVDRSSLPYAENVAQVSEIVKIAHAAGVSVEAELGHVGQGESYAADRDAGLTNPEQAMKYIQDTGIDMLAVAVGTAHGEYVGEPHIDFDRLAAIKKATNNFPLVLHGGSGTGDENLAKACRMGINKVNIYTDLAKSVVKKVSSVSKAGMVWGAVIAGVKEQIGYYIELFGGKGKAWAPVNYGISGAPVDMSEKK